eukprot:TRINITY_DN4199_c0_g1_i2.p1 TRINITY_DN4199_c0_g1~~TRINITY_DN4199_c0_g1_i2.p1  ORF type:complete len:270 (-),score=60.96 TRINITY_DN4199_c0_g1_i2:88-897(-)
MAVAEGRGGSGAPQAAASGSDGQEATKPSVCSLLQELAGVKSLRRGLVLNLSKGKLEEKAQRTFPAREAAAGGGPARQAYDVRQAALAKPSRQAQQERASRSRSPKNSRREKEKARSSSRESSGSTASSAVAPHEVAVGAKVKLQLSKMGEFCCNAMATLVKQGGKESRLLPDKLEINQRTKVENCRQHLELVGLASSALWHVAAEKRRDCAAYDALCDYFVKKERVGLVQGDSYNLYIIPPTKKYLKELGLPTSNYLVGLHVPNVKTA